MWNIQYKLFKILTRFHESKKALLSDVESMKTQKALKLVWNEPHKQFLENFYFVTFCKVIHAYPTR